MPERVSIDEVIAKRKDITDDDGVIYKAQVQPRSWNDDERSANFTISAETEDSYGDVVMQSGIDIESRFNANPIGLFGHRSWDMPIGTWSDVKMVRSTPKRTQAKLTFTAEGVDDLADRVARHVKAGTLKATSIGFQSKDAERIMDDENRWAGGYRFLESELMEVSVVTIPAVRQALIRGKAADADICGPEVIEEFLDHLAEHPEIARLVDKAVYERVMREIGGSKNTVEFKAGKMALPTADIEYAPRSVTSALSNRIERLEQAAGIKPEPEPDSQEQREAEALDEFERYMNQAAEDMEPKAEELAATGKTRLSRGIDSIKSLFQAPEPEPPALAKPEAKEALRKRLAAFEARQAS